MAEIAVRSQTLRVKRELKKNGWCTFFWGTTDPRSIKNVSALFTGGSSDPNYLAVEMGFDNAAGPAVKAIYDDVDETDCIEFLTENNECKILTEAVKYFDCITQGNIFLLLLFVNRTIFCGNVSVHKCVSQLTMSRRFYNLCSYLSPNTV